MSVTQKETHLASGAPKLMNPKWERSFNHEEVDGSFIASGDVGGMGVSVTSAQDQSIVDIAAGNEDFSTLVSLVQAADLVDVLSGELDPSLNFTVFAPTNAAFAQLPQEGVDALLSDPVLLTRVLTYHVSLDVYTSDELTALATVPSSNYSAMGRR